MIQLPLIEPGSTQFPHTQSALDEPNGLLAFGGDLSVSQLIAAYRAGIFPWYDDESPILWWTPSPRLVMWPHQLHISKSMKKMLRKAPYKVTTDQAFRAVMEHCAAPRDDHEETWITDEMIDAYDRLHQAGHAHSIEVWEDGVLIGGLYGVALGGVYFGESMFSRKSNASKYGFIALTLTLESLGYSMIDCQVHSSHLESLGATEISREEFEQNLINNRDRPSVWPTEENITQVLLARLS